MQTITSKKQLEYAEYAFGTKIDAKETLEENVKLLTERLGPIAYMRQVHGNRIVYSTHQGAHPEADAMFTDHTDLWLAVATADVAPILISCPYAVAVVHGCWRSLSEGLLEETIELLCEEFEIDPIKIHLMIGPCIKQVHYDVSEDKLKHFDEKFFRPSKKTKGRYLMDLTGIIVDKAKSAGVALEHIYDADIDTYEDPEKFYSYRRAKEAGKEEYHVQLSLIKLKA